MLQGFSMKGRLYVKYKVKGLEKVILFKEFLKEVYNENTNGKNTLVDSPKDGR